MVNFLESILKTYKESHDQILRLKDLGKSKKFKEVNFNSINVGRGAFTEQDQQLLKSITLLKDENRTEKSKFSDILDNEIIQNYLIYNILLISQDTDEKKFDGFPLALVFFDVVNKALSLIKTNAAKIKTKK